MQALRVRAKLSSSNSAEGDKVPATVNKAVVLTWV